MENKLPFFSIIIPTYNRAHTIRKPIDSIIAQTYTDWELVIVDDGSSDDSKAIVESYEDPRIRYIWQENQERSSARNHGIRLAKGEWICFQDSDDEYLPEHLQVLYDGIEEHPEYKIIRTGLLIYENEKYIGKSGIQPTNKYDQYPFECFTTATFYNELFIFNGFKSDLFILEDLHLLLKLSLNYPIKVLLFWTGIYHYDPKSSGGIGPKYDLNLRNKINSLDDILSWKEIPVLNYILKQRCLSEILLLYGHIQYQPQKIFESLGQNFKCFLRFPLEYLKLVIRIIYVNIGEWSGLYRTKSRF